ncbi:hypothetical protein L1887_18157 [Cichorium endivia]|nr:hypothetical protein L1887_18157 [Cichorium endivia]
MLSISLGVAISAYSKVKFNSWGVMIQLGAICFEPTRLVLIQILLTSKGITFNPITSLHLAKEAEKKATQVDDESSKLLEEKSADLSRIIDTMVLP